MSFLHVESFWIFLFLVPVFIFKNYRDLNFTSYGYILSFVLVVFALSRPVIEQEPIKSEQILSDVIVAVDLSYSMRAEDIQPSRLKKAKETLKKLVQSNKNTRYAVLGFTTNAIVLSPLTQDSQLLLHLYNTLDENLIITKGSSILPVLELASKVSKSKEKQVVILSDGADELNYEDEAKFAKANGLVVNVLMLGTKYGATITTQNGELLRDELGDIVITRENEAISSISNATGGIYTKDFEELRSALESQKNKEHKTQTMIVQNREFFYYFIALAVLVFLVTLTNLKRYVIAFFLLFGISVNAQETNNEYAQEASGFYKEGKYEKALVNYEMIKSSNAEIKSLVYYNIGNSYIRLKEYKKAREAFLKSLTLSYSKEADENLRFIKNVSEEKQMKTGQQKSKNRSSLAKQEKSEKNSKKGGSSNMKVSAKASSGKAKLGEKTKSEAMLNLKQAKAKLSSAQYELINKRGANEKQPW